ncbi:MAG: c-type cytochrome biogenesis protein CcmI [Methyloprofundus sp.]|nr:c-type cytochrome biogenesis protein CcmI [Methyloprofundus sp.]
MMTLWAVFAAMLLLAVVIVLWPLAVYKASQDSHPEVSQKQENVNIFQERLAELEYEQAQGNLEETDFHLLKTELEKNLLGDVQLTIEEQSIRPAQVSAMNWLVMGGVACSLVIVSILTYQSLGASQGYEEYLALGEPAGVMPKEGTRAAPTQAQNMGSEAPDFDAAVIALKAKLEENPQDIEKWFLLANSYMAMGKYNEASAVYKKMSGLVGKDNPGYASVKAAYAQTLFQLSGEKMTAEAQQAVDEAIAVDPEEPTALILLGLHAYQQDRYSDAISLWEKAKIKAGKAQISQFINPAIAQTQRKMGVTVPVVAAVKAKPAAAPVKKSTSTQSASITIHLNISPAFKAKLNPEERIFVFAKAKMPMPLAAERLQVKDLPITIVLDDTKAAMPTAKLSSADFVEITARVALSGSPRAAKGDLFATAKNVSVQQGVEITLLIDQVVE